MIFANTIPNKVKAKLCVIIQTFCCIRYWTNSKCGEKDIKNTYVSTAFYFQRIFIYLQSIGPIYSHNRQQNVDLVKLIV
jgi:hypothetical protein